MTTLAEQIAAGKKKPTPAVEQAMKNAETASKTVHDGINEAVLSLGYAALFMENGADNLQDAKTKAEAKAADDRENGTYAYSFVELEDGSCLAVYVTRYGEAPRLEPFESLSHTRFWHPTRQLSAFTEQE